MESLNTAIIIVAIIQVVTLIVFFVMAANVAKIKKQFPTSQEELIYKAKEAIYLGDTEMAKRYLLKAMFSVESYYGDCTSDDAKEYKASKMKPMQDLLDTI